MKNNKKVETEKCVLCKQDTGINKLEPVLNRKHYIEGAGQLCENCFRKLYN